METKLLISDLNGVLTDQNLAVNLLRYIPDERVKSEAIDLFRRYQACEIGERELVIEGSKKFRGLSYELVQEQAAAIAPRISTLNLPSWQTAIVSLDYQEAVDRVGKLLGIPHRYGNRIIYEGGHHSGRVKDPVVDFEEKKRIVTALKRKLDADLVVGIDNERNSPFSSVCVSVYYVYTRQDLERVLASIRTL